MKTVVIAACTLLLGLFLGSLGPRADVRRLEKELAEARETAARGSGPAVLPMALGALAAAAGDQPTTRRPLPRFVVPDGGGAEEAREEPSDRPDGGRRRRGLFGFRDESAFQAAKAAADVRAAQFRAAFFQEANLAPDRQAAVDETIKKMNGELAQAADDLAQTLQKKTRLTPRDMADMASKLLDVYRRADDQLKTGLDQTALGAMERTKFDLSTQLDLGNFRNLVQQAETLGRQSDIR